MGPQALRSRLQQRMRLQDCYVEVMGNYMKYTILLVLLFSGCGGAATSAIKTVGGENSPSTIAVQLNDMWNQVFPSESVQLADSRLFVAPNQIDVVGGSYGGSTPTQYLRARINTPLGSCDYQSTGINDPTLVLQS